MAYYRFDPDVEHYDSLILPDDNKWELFPHPPTGALAPSWRAPKVEIIPSPARRNRGGPVDFPSLGFDVPVVSRRALDCLHPLLAPHVEVLPLAGDKLPLHALNVLTRIPCFDFARSHYEQLDDGLLCLISKYVLKEECIRGEPIFRLAEHPTSLFVSDEFRRIVEQHRLTGLLWNEVELSRSS